ncbi:EcsC family protein [Acerihabitans sp. KWT182]|uniref:EcsC family protein n=1 Tax=Acerihabitans sp. KWT182 TaxID=3157919 RepID=A0AAU7QG14_9GAMM
MQETAKTLGIRLTKAKLAQTLPVVGAVIGGGYNACFTRRICDAAYHLYRERFLMLKFGAHIINIGGDPVAHLPCIGPTNGSRSPAFQGYY